MRTHLHTTRIVVRIHSFPLLDLRHHGFDVLMCTLYISVVSRVGLKFFFIQKSQMKWLVKVGASNGVTPP